MKKSWSVAGCTLGIGFLTAVLAMPAQAVSGGSPADVKNNFIFYSLCNSSSKHPRKPRDRFDEIKDVILDVGSELSTRISSLEKKVEALDTKTGLQYDKLSHEFGLVIDTVTGHGEKLDIIQQDIELIKYDLKEKVDNVDVISLSHRISILEKKLASKK